MRRLILLVAALVIFTAACQDNKGTADTSYQGSGPTELGSPKSYKLALEKGPANLGQLKMNLNQLGPFHGQFVLEFEGQSQWVYQVDIRSDGTNIEYQLTLQGVESGQNLGDVRLVNSIGINYMSGAGTGDSCVQFPDSFETEPLFLGPTDFIHLKEFSSQPEESGSDAVLGRETIRYSTSATYHMGWQDVSVSFWLDSQTEAVLRYEFMAAGNDPLYQQGDGRVHGTFEVLEIGLQQIKAIPGCVIEFPLPEDAAGIIRFPGLLSYTTSLGPTRLDRFYSPLLETEGWVREDPQINAETRDGVLEFNAQGRSVIIHVAALNTEDFSEGFQIEIFLDE